MSLLGLFKKKPVFIDKVYRTDQLKNDNFIKQLRKSFSDGNIPVIVYHFPGNHKSSLNLLNQNQISYQEHQDFNWLSDFNRRDWDNKPVAFIVSASILSSLANLTFSRLENSNIVNISDVYLLEHHPLLSKDELIFNFQDVPSFKFNYLAFMSFEDPLLKVFGGDNLTSLLDRLGMSEDECLSHPWISKSIVRAQKKVAQSASGDSECENSTAWFSKYYPKHAGNAEVLY
jgi:hypothetical protein